MNIIPLRKNVGDVIEAEIRAEDKHKSLLEVLDEAEAFLDDCRIREGKTPYFGNYRGCKNDMH